MIVTVTPFIPLTGVHSGCEDQSLAGHCENYPPRDGYEPMKPGLESECADHYASRSPYKLRIRLHILV